jgi:methanol--5-hydroxybenzimidazolylcobamide Co-methyltransferase
MDRRELAVAKAEDLRFGFAPRPVKTRRGLVLGGGEVYPELNFTVPAGTVINRSTQGALEGQYRGIAEDALSRAVRLEVPGVVLELETLVEMTTDPVIGVGIVRAMDEVCEAYFQRHGLRSEIRLTPNDAREFERPPHMRSGPYLEAMLQLFEEGAAAGGDLLSIETTGGKELHDEALMMCDIRGVVFSLAVLGVRDMRFIWEKIVAIARAQGKIAGGDTACGFANTAMVLAEKDYIPRVFAALVRVISAVRSVVAVEMGAVGPHKDCGYEGVYVKAITGIPISMEGKTAACAHFSSVGNIAAAAADLWSNESVQNIKLLGGMAPTAYLEQLAYDARLMNTAIRLGPAAAAQLQRLMVESDIHTDPQAFVLAPEVVVALAGEMVAAPSPLAAAVRAGLKAVAMIEAAAADGSLALSDREKEWIPRLRDELASIPADESRFVDEMMPLIEPGKFLPAEYGL